MKEETGRIPQGSTSFDSSNGGGGNGVHGGGGGGGRTIASFAVSSFTSVSRDWDMPSSPTDEVNCSFSLL